MRRDSSFAAIAGSCRLAWAAIAMALLVFGLTTTAIAQHVVPETPRVGAPPGLPPGGGTGGGAGLMAPMPRSLSVPKVAPPPVAPAAPAVVAPAAPPRVVRFRCDLAPEAEACKDPGAPDGGGDDSECTCAHDDCHDRTDPATGALGRVCEKLQ
jgi:hypothetical protein